LEIISTNNLLSRIFFVASAYQAYAIEFA